MGFIDTLIGTANALSGPSESGGMSPVGAPTGPTATTISPTFQQKFTAQVSPVISPIIGSAGATGGTATAMQVAPGGQQAEGGGTLLPAPSPYGAPSPLSLPSLATQTQSPLYQDSFDITRYVPPGVTPAEIEAGRRGFDWGQATPWLIGGGVALAAIFMFAPSPASRR